MTDSSTAQDFPNFDENTNKTVTTKGNRNFINHLYPNDSLTVCDGFINEVRPHAKGDRTMYFVNVGLFQGSVQDGDNYKGDIVNCAVLAGATLGKWLSGLAGVEDPLKGVRLRMEFRNLKFLPKLHEGKAYVDSRGILETVQIGRLVKNY